MEIHRIQCGNVNAYAINSASGAFWVDTGRGGDLETIEEQLRAKGVQPDRLKLVILTHAHTDHAGCAAEFKDKYHMPIAMAEDEVPGRPVFSRGVTGRVLLGASRRQLSRQREIVPNVVLTDGQKLHEFGLPGRIIALPGHTGGSIGLLLEGGKLLIAGDMYMNFFQPSLAHIFEDGDRLADSHQKLCSLSVETVYPGHGKPFPFSAVKKG